jgi:hypothetical protein
LGKDLAAEHRKDAVAAVVEVIGSELSPRKLAWQAYNLGPHEQPVSGTAFWAPRIDVVDVSVGPGHPIRNWIAR